jgi:hypothetical protein
MLRCSLGVDTVRAYPLLGETACLAQAQIDYTFSQLKNFLDDMGVDIVGGTAGSLIRLYRDCATA